MAAAMTAAGVSGERWGGGAWPLLSRPPRWWPRGWWPPRAWLVGVGRGGWPLRRRHGGVAGAGAGPAPPRCVAAGPPPRHTRAGTRAGWRRGGCGSGGCGGLLLCPTTDGGTLAPPPRPFSTGQMGGRPAASAGRLHSVMLLPCVRVSPSGLLLRGPEQECMLHFPKYRCVGSGAAAQGATWHPAPPPAAATLQTRGTGVKQIYTTRGTPGRGCRRSY